MLMLAAIVALCASAGCREAAAHDNPPSSNAPSVYGTNQTFVANLQLAAPNVSTDQAATYEGLGRTICSELQSGATIQQEVSMIHRHHIDGALSVGILNGAVSGYCPVYSQALEEWAN
jgi:Protein of unknown function (DUF732)